jgi:Secretion system C-terminal sorting domain
MAQPVLTAADFPSAVGAISSQAVVDHVAPVAPGNNFVMDASMVTLGAFAATQLVLPSTTPYAASFPNANRASGELTNPQAYSYSDYSNTGILFYGVGSAAYQLVYSDPEKTFQFPLSLSNTWTDAWSATGNGGGQISTRSGTTTGSYNGYGTLILPYGTFTNVARFQLDQTYSDVIPGFGSISYIARTVAFIKPGYGSSMFSSSYLLADYGAGFDTASVYSVILDPALAAVEEHAPSIRARLYPNPASDAVTIQLDEHTQELQVTLLDALGREVRSFAPSAPLDGHMLKLDLTTTSSGFYTARLMDRTGRSAMIPFVVR